MNEQIATEKIAAQLRCEEFADGNRNGTPDGPQRSRQLRTQQGPTAHASRDGSERGRWAAALLRANWNKGLASLQDLPVGCMPSTFLMLGQAPHTREAGGIYAVTRLQGFLCGWAVQLVQTFTKPLTVMVYKNMERPKRPPPVLIELLRGPLLCYLSDKLRLYSKYWLREVRIVICVSIDNRCHHFFDRRARAGRGRRGVPHPARRELARRPGGALKLPSVAP